MYLVIADNPPEIPARIAHKNFPDRKYSIRKIRAKSKSAKNNGSDIASKCMLTKPGKMAVKMEIPIPARLEFVTRQINKPARKIFNPNRKITDIVADEMISLPEIRENNAIDAG
jgi:hypothetical protein